MLRHSVLCLSYVILLSFLFMPSAHAYLDPGTASMLLQALAAGAVSILVFGKRIYAFVSTRFSSPRKSETSTAPDSGESQK